MSFATILDTLTTIIWSPALVFVCLAVGIFFTISTLFMQIRCIPDMFQQMVGNDDSESGVSSFKAGSALAILPGWPPPSPTAARGLCSGCGSSPFSAPPHPSWNAPSPRYIRRKTRIPASTGVGRPTILKKPSSTRGPENSCWCTPLFLRYAWCCPAGIFSWAFRRTGWPTLCAMRGGLTCGSARQCRRCWWASSSWAG